MLEDPCLVGREHSCIDTCQVDKNQKLTKVPINHNSQPWLISHMSIPVGIVRNVAGDPKLDQSPFSTSPKIPRFEISLIFNGLWKFLVPKSLFRTNDEFKVTKQRIGNP